MTQKNNSEVVTTKKSNFPNTRPKSLLTPPKKSHAHFPLKNGRETGKKIENKSKRVKSDYINPGIYR